MYACVYVRDLHANPTLRLLRLLLHLLRVAPARARADPVRLPLLLGAQPLRARAVLLRELPRHVGHLAPLRRVEPDGQAAPDALALLGAFAFLGLLGLRLAHGDGRARVALVLVVVLRDLGDLAPDRARLADEVEPAVDVEPVLLVELLPARGDRAVEHGRVGDLAALVEEPAENNRLDEGTWL
jgi:hypothetical protein